MKNLFKHTTFLAIVACWLWSTAFVGIKVGLHYHTPLQFAGLRFTIAGLMLFFYFGKPKRFITEVRENLRFVILLSFIQVFLQYTLFYSGINLVPGAMAAMVVGSQPLFVALVSHFSFKNDKMTLLKTSSIIIGVIGIAIITLGRASVEFKGKLEFLGLALLLTNNCVSGISNVIIAKKSANISPVVFTSASLIIGGIFLGLVSVPIEGMHHGSFPTEYWVALAWLSFLSAAAISIWNSLLKRPGVKVSILNVWKFLIPVSGAALSWLLIPGETPDLISIVGMCVIAVSLLSLNYANRKNQRKLEACKNQA